ncbi:MAG: type toxin-antitoxin system RelE/ParE family toxin [Rhizobium sp.]|nr:type toxin-antitoxin system RelE/ParE family toxin [Rhizobium sp.]
MPRLRYLASVDTDFREILKYIARESGNVTVGKAFIASIRDKRRHLASLPGMMGRPRPEIYPDIRSFAFGNYVVFFRYIDDRFEVVNILERHRDLESFFDSHSPE